MPAKEAANLEAALRAAGLRVTHPRLVILRALHGRDDAVTAQQLHAQLRRSGRGPGLATVYRTLAALAEAGELDSLTKDGEQAFRRCARDHHHHLVCDSCGSVTELRSDEVESWVSQVARRRGFRVRSHTADIYGTCKACS